MFPFGVLPELEACLKQQRALADQLSRQLGIAIPWVFFTARGTPFYPRSGPNSALRKAWRRALAAAGLGSRLIHDFRRSACRNLVQAGVPESEAMKLTGHKTDRVFRDYNISTFEDRKISVANSYHVHESAFVTWNRPRLPDRISPTAASATSAV